MIKKLSFFSLLLLLLFTAQAQVEENVVFPTNNYIYTNTCNPYPMVDQAAIAAIDRDSLVNVLDYGVIGNGTSNDNTAFVNAVNTALNNSKYKGILIPAGKTVMLDRLNTFALNKDFVVFQDGNIKMMNKKKYSAIQFDYPKYQQTHNFFWIANGTANLDGNQYNQIWPTNPHGGDYDGPFVEAHGRFVGVSWASFAIFYRVRQINSVMDGPTVESCKLGVIAHSKASGGAPFNYVQDGDQGTYFKSTRLGLKTTYFLYDTTDAGSIQYHVSFPEKEVMDTATLTVFYGCVGTNAYQQPIHIEDCHKNFLVNCTLSNTGFGASTHFSNRTALVYMENVIFNNQRANFNQASSLRLGIIKNCSFNATLGSDGGQLLPYCVWGATHVINTTFKGTTDTFVVKTNYIKRALISNWGSKQYAVKGASIVDSVRFDTGNKTMNLANGGKRYHNTYINSTGTNDTPSGNWEAPFQSKIIIRNLNGDILKVLTAK